MHEPGAGLGRNRRTPTKGKLHQASVPLLNFCVNCAYCAPVCPLQDVFQFSQFFTSFSLGLHPPVTARAQVLLALPFQCFRAFIVMAQGLCALQPVDANISTRAKVGTGLLGWSCPLYASVSCSFIAP